MTVDSRTLWLATGICGLAIGLLLCLQCLATRERAMILWGVGNLVAGVGALLISFRHALDDVWTIPVGNVLVVLGWATIAAGFGSFNGRRITVSWVVTPTVAMAAGYAALFWADAWSAASRGAVIGTVLVGVICWTAVDCLRAQRRERFFWRRVQLAVLAGWVVALLVRIVGGLLWTPWADPAGNSPFQVATVTVLMVLTTTNGVLCLQVSRERVDRELTMATLHDSETGLFNRAGLAHRYAELAASRATVAMLLVDIDGFKEINDAHGHLVGDAVLRHFAAIVRRHTVSGDLAARYGGDEFCVLLVGRADADSASVAEALRAEFADRPAPSAVGDIVATVSVGVCTIRAADTSLEHAIGQADAALYRAKRDGRDRVETTRR